MNSTRTYSTKTTLFYAGSFNRNKSEESETDILPV